MTKAIITRPFDEAALESAHSLLTKKGNTARAESVWPVIEAVASSIYANARRKEQFFDAPTGNVARHALFDVLHKANTQIARAFRTMLAVHGAALVAGSRELTQEAHDATLAALLDTFITAATPAPRAASDPADKDARALARAVETIRSQAACLTSDQAEALSQALATAQAILTTTNARAKVSAPAPTTVTVTVTDEATHA